MNKAHPYFKKVIGGFLFLLSAPVFPAASSNIIVDQFGYRPNDPKIVILAQPNKGVGSPSSFTPGATFYVINASGGATVFTGTPAQWGGGAAHFQSGDKAWQGTFTSLTTPGTYYIQVPGGSNPGAVSYNFKIQDTVFNGVETASQRMFFYQRCGMAIGSTNGVSWVHSVCHEGGNQDLVAHLWDVGADQGAGTARDIHGGWHDAGDYNKYVTFAYATMWYLLHSVEWYPLGYGDSTNIPESGNGVPDMLDEVKWELDWMLRMQRASDGALYSVVGTTAYGATGDPSSDSLARYYTNVSTTSTATGAMAFALGARILQAYPAYASYAVTLQNAAVSAWSYLQANPSEVNYSNAGLVNADGNQSAAWDAQARVGAAAELFALTGGASYQTYFDNNYNSAVAAGPVANPPTATDMFDPSLAEPLELGMVSYCLAPGATAAKVAAIRNAVKNECEWNIIPNNPGNSTTGDPYMSYMYDGHYTWGSNQLKAAWGNQLLFAVEIGANTPQNTVYTNQAEEYLHYFHGRNPLNWVYLTNMGTKGANLGASNSIMSIYHSWFFVGTTYDGNTGAGALGPAPGILAGGPNRDYAPASGFISPPQSEPPMKSYKDWGAAYPDDSWEVTEPDQGYQGKYQFLLSAFAVSNAATATPTATPTGTLATATFTPTRTATSTATLTPTPTATTCVQLLNGEETINENGNWTGTNATRSISTTDITQLNHSLQAAVTNNPVGGWNDQIFNLDNFMPSNFSNVLQVMVDINVPAGMIGSTYSQLYLSADSAPTTYEQPLASNFISLTAGQNNNVTFNISLTGAFTPSSPITKLYLIYNSNAATGPGAYGSFYVDNIRLITNCAATSTFTPTRTLTPTFTRTATFSPTVSLSPTGTSTSTLSPTLTPSPTPSNTPANTLTPTSTLTSSLIPTSSFTVTPTFTPTHTTSPTLTGTPTSTITGILSQSSTPTATGTPSMTFTLTSSLTPTKTNTTTSTPTLTATLSSTPTRTATASFTPSNTFAFTATSTYTQSRTLTFTPSSTSTNSFTATLTPTATLAKTLSPTFTFSATLTRTSTPAASPGSQTATATPGKKPVIYPNPADGTESVRLSLNLTAASDVQIKIFTVAFRKIREQSYDQVPAGENLVLDLNDNGGKPLASGLYYLVIATAEGRFLEKLLVLR